MSEMIRLQSADGFEFGALHAAPKGPRRGGIVVVPAIFGVDQYIVADVARWADKGFEAVAPSLFDRVEFGFTAGHDAAGFARGFAALDKTPPEQALADIAAAIAFLKPRGQVFMVGYCYGGFMTWRAAGELDGIAAASSYYGGGVAEAAALTPRCPVICHFGRNDPHIPPEESKAALNAAQPQVPVYIYENSGHGFNNAGRADADPADAELARQRTLAHFEAHGAR